MGNLDALFDEVPQEEQVVESSPEGAEVENNAEQEKETDVGETGGETETQETGTEEQEGEQESEESVAVEETPGEEPAPKESEGELTALRALLRQQNQKLRALEKQAQRTQKELVEKGVVEEPDEEEAAQRNAASAMRASQLETILEVMRLNPRFEDVDEVVTQSRFDDMVEGFATVIAKERGEKVEDVIDAVQSKIWSMANPYRFMYEKIKEHHPDFQKPKEDPTKLPVKPEMKKEPKQTPTTVSKLAAGDADTQSGWTSARIDAMPEEDLGKVPRDVYEKYLSGELK